MERSALLAASLQSGDHAEAWKWTQYLLVRRLGYPVYRLDPKLRNFRDIPFIGWDQKFYSITRNFQNFKICLPK